MLTPGVSSPPTVSSRPRGREGMRQVNAAEPKRGQRQTLGSPSCFGCLNTNLGQKQVLRAGLRAGTERKPPSPGSASHCHLSCWLVTPFVPSTISSHSSSPPSHSSPAELGQAARGCSHPAPARPGQQGQGTSNIYQSPKEPGWRGLGFRARQLTPHRFVCARRSAKRR